MDDELVTLCATRLLPRSPKRCLENELSGGALVFNEFREETILLVSEIVGYVSSNKNSRGLHTSGIQCVCVMKVVVGDKQRKKLPEEGEGYKVLSAWKARKCLASTPMPNTKKRLSTTVDATVRSMAVTHKLHVDLH